MKASHGDSWSWKNICKSRELIQKGACRLIGDGKSTIIWEHPWVPGINGYKTNPRGFPSQGSFLVADFILADGSWDYPKIMATFHPHDATAISRIILPSFPRNDSWIWVPSATGRFSTKSAYRTDQKQRFSNTSLLPNIYWNKLWHSKIHPRHKILWWQIILDALPTREKLAKLFPIEDLMCPLCNRHPESAEHLFLHCDVAQRIWFSSAWNLRTSPEHSPTMADWFRFIWDLNASPPLKCFSFHLLPWKLSGKLEMKQSITTPLRAYTD